MKYSKRQIRLQKKLYRMAEGNEEQTEALNVIFDITKDLTNEQAAWLIATAMEEVKNKKTAQEIYGLEKAPSASFLEQVKLFECPKCEHLLLAGKEEGGSKCKICGMVMVESSKPLSGLRME